jgi:S-adenosylmethionine-diacylglycerol 3-amino-3-carboxypropyl transferase
VARNFRSRPLYSACNEDTRSERVALAIGPEDTVVSIAAGGGRTLSLLAAQPARMIAVDRSVDQLHVLELKAVAMESLEHRELLRFLGVEPEPARLEIFEMLRGSLSPSARRYWDARPHVVEEGLLYAGRAEVTARRFMGILRAGGLLAWVEEWFEQRTLADQEAFLARAKGRLRLLELAIRLYCHPAVVFPLTRDHGFLRSSQGSIGRYMFDRILRWSRTHLVRDSFALRLFYFGCYDPRGPLPIWLEPEGYARARKALSRLELQHARVEDYAKLVRTDGPLKWSLSDVSAWMSERTFHDLVRSLVLRGGPGSRLCARHFAVVRALPLDLRSRLDRREAVAREIDREDASVFWRFEVAGYGE